MVFLHEEERFPDVTRFCLPRSSCYRLLVFHDLGAHSMRASYDGEVFFDVRKSLRRSIPKSILFGDSCKSPETTSVVEVFYEHSTNAPFLYLSPEARRWPTFRVPYQIIHSQGASSDSSIQGKNATLVRLNNFYNPSEDLYYSKFETPRDSCIKFGDSFPCFNDTRSTKIHIVVDGIVFGERFDICEESGVSYDGEFRTVFAGACSKNRVCEEEQIAFEIGISTRDLIPTPESPESSWTAHWSISYQDDLRFHRGFVRQPWTQYADFSCLPRIDSCALLHIHIHGNWSELAYYAKVHDSLVPESRGCVDFSGGTCPFDDQRMTRLVNVDCPLLPLEIRREKRSRRRRVVILLALGLVSVCLPICLFRFWWTRH